MHGYDEDKAKVIARLRRIEGQVRAITQMVEDDLNHCVRQASIQGGEVADEKLAEASAAIARLVKS